MSWDPQLNCTCKVPFSQRRSHSYEQFQELGHKPLFLQGATVPPTTSFKWFNNSFEIKQKIQDLPFCFSLRLSLWFYFPFTGRAVGSSSMKKKRLPLAVSTLAIQLPRELRAMSWWVWVLFLSRNLPAIRGPGKAGYTQQPLSISTLLACTVVEMPSSINPGMWKSINVY